MDSKGHAIDHFLGLVHVSDMTSLSLNIAFEAVFSMHNLSMLRIHGHNYDGASKMKGEFNCLKTLIMKVNASAYYIHCFNLQLQLALIVVAKNHVQIILIFYTIMSVVNIISTSCKCKDVLLEKQLNKVEKV